LGSGFSPIGNPQNFYIYTNSNLPFWEFLLPLLPPFLLSAGLLIGVTALLLPPRQLEEHPLPHSTPSKLLGIGGVVGLVGVIGGIESGIPLLLSLPALLLPLLYKKLDWGLIATFGLFILDSDLARELPGVQHLLSTLSPLPEWEAGLLLSQLISNFPATLLLFPSSSDPIGLALGVNLGGNGVLWASLANLIALRPLHSPKIYLTFHLYSIPALLISTGIALLFLR
jgi:Na+/H+ antiporter NhaD/arsenite permease-like protein